MYLVSILGISYLLQPALSIAQTTTGTFGTILGVVTDETGAVIPRSNVSVINEKTGIERTAETDEQGVYRVLALLPGVYTVQLEVKGFKKTQQKGVELRVNESLRVDVTLQLGDLSQVVEVEAAVRLLQTESGTVGHVVNNRQVVELPLNGRDFTQLTLLIPGSSPGSQGGGFLVIGGNNVSVTGNRSDSNNYTLDGVDNNENFFKFHALKPSIDAIEEFKIQTNITSAQFGNAAGANINVATKSGTNEFHGTLFHFLRNDVLDSRDYFNDSRPSFRFNNFGGTVGGPFTIPGVYNGKDRTFWFFDYEGLRRNRGSTILGIVPTPEMLAGDLSRDYLGNLAPPIFDPSTGRLVNGTIVRDPFPGNLIPPSRINPVVAEYARLLFPAPNRPGQIFDFINLMPERLNSDQFTTRADHNFSPKTNLFGRFSLSNLEFQSPASFPTFTPVVENAFHNATLNLVHIFIPTTILDFKWGFNRNTLPVGSDSFRLIEALKAKGLTGIPDKFGQFDFPIDFFVVGFSGAGSLALQTGPNDNLQFLPNLSLIRGRHTLAVGADVKREVVFHDGNFASWGFDNVPTADPQNVGETGQALASFLLGLPSNASRLLGDTSLHGRRTLWHFYGQDDIKLTTNLTVNLGLRYEYSPWFTPIEGRLSGFDTTVPGGRFMWASRNPITGEPANAPPTLVDPVRTNFAPRFGIAYLLTPETTIRAGYGIFYNSNFTWETSSGRGNWPYAISEGRSGINSQFPLEPLQPVEIIFAKTIDPAKVAPDIQHTMSRRQRVGYMQQWNLHIQRELTKGLLLEVGYVGTKGTKLSAFLNSNDALPGPGPVQPRRPFPNLSPFQENQSNGNSRYHGLTMKLEKRLSRSLSLITNYAFSKSLDQGSSFGGGAHPQNKLDFRAELGYSDFHSYHIFSSGYVAELPFGPGKRYLNGLRGLPAKLVGGWQISGVTALRSGRPFNIILNFDNANIGQSSLSLRPNLLGDAYPEGFRSIPAQWFNTTAFGVPSPYTFGNLGRNALLGPGFQSWDFGVFKNIPIREGVRLQFRSEFFNAFNNVNFGNPGGILGNPDFGQISYSHFSKANPIWVKADFLKSYSCHLGHRA